MTCECSDKILCPDALDLWGKVENAWDHLVSTGAFRPAIIDAYNECWKNYREHRKGLTIPEKSGIL